MDCRKRIPRSVVVRYARAWNDHLDREYREKVTLSVANARRMLADVEPEYRRDLRKRIIRVMKRTRDAERVSADKQIRKAVKDFVAQYNMGLLDDVDVSE